MDTEGYIVMDSRLSGDEYGEFEDVDFGGIENENGGKEHVAKEVDGELDVLSMEVDVCGKGDTCEPTTNSVTNIESGVDDISTKEDVNLCLDKKESEEISMDIDESGGDLELSTSDILEQTVFDSATDKTNSLINVDCNNLEKGLNDTRECEMSILKEKVDDNSKAIESKESEEDGAELENNGAGEERKKKVSNICEEINVIFADEEEINKDNQVEKANCSNQKAERKLEPGIANYAKECEVKNFLNNCCAKEASKKSTDNFNEICSEITNNSVRDHMEVLNDCVKSKLIESEMSKKENCDVTEDCKQGGSENLDDKKTEIAVTEDSKSDGNGISKVVKRAGNSLGNCEAENCIVLDDNNVEEIIIQSNPCKKSIEVKECERIASDDVLSSKKPLKNINRKNLDVICVDLKTDHDIVICDDSNRKPRKQCCNLECESRDTLTNAPVAILTHFGVKYVKGKSQKVCKQCFEKAVTHHEHLAYVLMEHKPLLKEEFPIRADIALIDDSDEEGSDEETPLGEDILLDVDDKLMEVIDSSMENYDLDFQVRESDVILQETYKNLKDEFLKTDDVFDKLQAEIDQLRSNLYLGFAPKIKELPFLDIIDTPDSNLSPEKRNKGSSNVVYISPSKRVLCSNLDSPRRSSLVGVATKKVTQVQRNVFPGLSQIETQDQQSLMHSQQEVVALEQVQQIRPVLPPLGPLSRPKPNIHDVLYVMKNGYYGMWARAKVLEVLTRQDITNPSKLESQFKIKFESRKSSMVKTVTGKQVAYPSPSPVRLPVGTRVIALFRDEWAKECYYAGIIAEPPKSMNKYRYLVFFDDGYAQYVCHEKILLVCESSRNVWDDIHPDSRDFVRNYLEQFPERPMLKLQRGQIVKTEWNGKWWIARVVEVDGSLVKMHFDADGRTELIYRGSTRLGPLYSELAHAAARKNMGSFSRHRSLGISSLKRRNMPYVEYTRSDLDENRLEDSGDMNRSLEKTMPSRAVAKKSTSKRSDSAREQLEALILSSDRDIQSGHVESIYINPSYKPKTFIPHQCGIHCVEGIKYDASQIKHYNPLVLPLLHGWQRHITRCKAKKIVIYRSPCGRRLRNMEELHRFLRVTQSNLPVDLFDYDSWVHCFSEFVMRTGFINIKDLSYGNENVPVPCVNNVDHSKPEYVKYSTVRLPMEGVNVNTDPQFLVCCDCTDDCQNKEKCACWQLTVQGTAYGTGGKVDTSVGYWYKRLREPVMTGIYECNARCKCSSTCLNRVAQHPLQLRLQVFKTENRGWGIRCLNDVPHGTFICIYAGRLLTEQGANEGGKNYGDEYLAELDYIEVVERLKDGYESDVVEDEDAPFSSNKEEKIKKSKAMSDEEEEEEGENSHDAHDSDYELDSRHHNIKVVPLEESTIRTRLRNRKARNSSIDSEDKEGGRDESMLEKGHKKSDERKGSILSSDDASSLITLSDDEDDEEREREPSRFAAMSGPKKETEKKISYKSVREYYGDDEFCYIMDAKNDGNIGRYLNHSCSPNVFVQNVFVDTHDLRFPWVAFFALTYISAGTELTWDYNYDVGSVPGKVLHCYCGSSDCRGRLL